MSKKFFLKIIAFILVLGATNIISYGAGIFTGKENLVKLQPNYIIDNTLEKPVITDFSIFWEVWNRLSDNFLEKDKLDSQKMVYGSISGMVQSLGDPYTTFFTPSEAESFNEELSGQYEGVGMVVGNKDGQLTVISPFKDSPSDRAGLKPEDKILKIDETFTKDLSIEAAVKIIKGPKGSNVRLLISRNNWKEPKEFTIKRENIKIPTLEKEIVGAAGDIALIKIYQFNRILPAEFGRAAEEVLNTPSVRGLIIDLRNNPGGFLDVAQEITGWFLPKEQVITWQDMGKDKEKKAYKSNGPAAFEKYKIAVLINNGSASGSEIMAGALRDQLGVKLIGEKSFGKGSVQEQISLTDESSLKVTIAKWLTPNGTSIDKEGLKPDIEVNPSSSTSAVSSVPNGSGQGEEQASNEEDVQLQKAIEFLENLP